MLSDESQIEFVICASNDKYPASLERRKVYRVLPDHDALSHNLLRVIDESGEDYLYPQELFIPVELPSAAEAMFSSAESR
jgi:hypothetical protein